MGVKVRWYDGAWYMLIDHQNRRKAKKFGTDDAAKRRAEEAARLIEAKLALGDLGVFTEPPVSLTLADFCELWLTADYVRRNLRPTTAAKYEEVMRKHWLPKLGKTELRELSRQHIRTAIRAFFRGGLANSSIRWFINVLQSCLSAAVEEGQLTHNPAEKSTKWLLRSTTTQNREGTSRVFTAPEIKLLLERAAARGRMTYTMTLTLLRTGLRISELMGLKVEDLGFERREIHVRRTWGNAPRGPDYYGIPKSGEQRLVDMSLRLEVDLQGWVATLPYEEGWLFPAKHGRPMTPNTFYLMHWWPLFVDADAPRQMRSAPTGGLIPYRTPHKSRHTFATHLLWQDESPVYVKEQLGHSSIRITVDVYGNSIRRDNKRAVDHLDDAVEAAKDLRKPAASDLPNGLRVIQGGRK